MDSIRALPFPLKGSVAFSDGNRAETFIVIQQFRVRSNGTYTLSNTTQMIRYMYWFTFTWTVTLISYDFADELQTPAVATIQSGAFNYVNEENNLTLFPGTCECIHGYIPLTEHKIEIP